MDDGNGVWRTINGARVFIRDGESVDDAIVQGEDTLIVDKDTLELDRALPTYSRELAEITRGGIPLWPADLDDD